MIDDYNTLPLPPKIRSRISALALLPMLLASACANKMEALDTPADVAVSASNRRLTVAWREISGATSYKIAVRLKNELVPVWREYPVLSSPYIIADRWAMSGMEYEVRVAAVNAGGASEWSAPVSITAPALQAAPADAIGIFAPLLVGETAVVAMRSRRPFASRSSWHWFMCRADGSDCKVLPRRRGQPTWQYFMEPELQGKCLSVQVDYDQDGASYSATAVLGVVAAEASTPHGPQ